MKYVTCARNAKTVFFVIDFFCDVTGSALGSQVELEKRVIEIVIDILWVKDRRILRRSHASRRVSGCLSHLQSLGMI